MSHKSLFKKLSYGAEDSYSKICAVQKPGCYHRHGEPLTGTRELEFKPCPNCLAKMRLAAGMSVKETRYESQVRKQKEFKL